MMGGRTKCQIFNNLSTLQSSLFVYHPVLAVKMAAGHTADEEENRRRKKSHLHLSAFPPRVIYKRVFPRTTRVCVWDVRIYIEPSHTCYVEPLEPSNLLRRVGLASLLCGDRVD